MNLHITPATEVELKEFLRYTKTKRILDLINKQLSTDISIYEKLEISLTFSDSKLMITGYKDWDIQDFKCKYNADFDAKLRFFLYNYGEEHSVGAAGYCSLQRLICTIKISDYSQERKNPFFTTTSN
jgi:hypothetical protein